MTIYRAKETKIVACKTIECSNCATVMGADAYNDNWNYCPYCGEEIENIKDGDSLGE